MFSAKVGPLVLFLDAVNWQTTWSFGAEHLCGCRKAGLRERSQVHQAARARAEHALVAERPDGPLHILLIRARH